jgi:hypothetical protein
LQGLRNSHSRPSFGCVEWFISHCLTYRRTLLLKNIHECVQYLLELLFFYEERVAHNPALQVDGPRLSIADSGESR